MKDERPTSNIEHRTSNNDVAPLLKLFQHQMKKQTPNTEDSTTPRRGFFSAVLILVTKILINSSGFFKLCFFIFSHSMFDVHFFQSRLGGIRSISFQSTIINPFALTSVLCPLSSVLCPLSSVLCPLSSVLCLLSSVLRPLTSDPLLFLTGFFFIV